MRSADINRVVAVTICGGFLGFWMFAIRGAALFAGLGLAIAIALASSRARLPRVLPVVVLLVAAALLWRSSTLGWGGADVPDGSRFKASPVGLSHVLTPDQPTSGTLDCGWHDVSGYPDRCEVGDPAAFARLRTVYPLLLGSALGCIAAVLFAVARGPRFRIATRITASLSLAAASAALVLFATSMKPALAALDKLPIGTGGTLGTMQLSVALLGVLSIVVVMRPLPAATATH